MDDKEHRHLLVSATIKRGLAFQIRAMREARGWTQEELAERAGMKQERISLLENPDYGYYTLSTLKRLASVFDVALEAKFVPFSTFFDFLADMTPDDLAVPSYEP
jgi:HTH-type transcriptional regulator/antitoxin HipB